jgi:hypothetical protein
MGRLGSSVPPPDFVGAVIEAFRFVEPVADSVVYGRFRRSRAWFDFRELLRHAALQPGSRILCVGCGPALAGRNAFFASAAVRELYPWATPDLFEITSGEWRFKPGSYDCVVSHSLLHFVYDPIPDCEAIHVRGGATPDTVARINLHLRSKFGLQDDLTVKEIVRLADPHQPDEHPGDFVYGSDGLDWASLSCGFKLDEVRTSGYVMRENPARVPDRWRKLNDDLASRYPLDGCSFSALWRK